MSHRRERLEDMPNVLAIKDSAKVMPGKPKLLPRSHNVEGALKFSGIVRIDEAPEGDESTLHLDTLYTDRAAGKNFDCVIET
jgi:hypothetical protein